VTVPIPTTVIIAESIVETIVNLRPARASRPRVVQSENSTTASGEQATARAQEVAIALEHLKAVQQHDRLAGDRARWHLLHPLSKLGDRLLASWSSPRLRGIAIAWLERAGDARRTVIGADEIALQERHEPPCPTGGEPAVEVDDGVTQRRAGQARGRGHARHRSEFGGELTESGDAFGREEVRIIVGGKHGLVGAESPRHPRVGHEGRVGTIEHRIDRPRKLESFREEHRTNRDRNGEDGEAKPLIDQKS
jgi:hypothetical protein